MLFCNLNSEMGGGDPMTLGAAILSEETQTRKYKHLPVYFIFHL